MTILLVLLFLIFSMRLTFTILKPWSLIILHMKFKIHGCSGLRDHIESDSLIDVLAGCTGRIFGYRHDESTPYF